MIAFAFTCNALLLVIQLLLPLVVRNDGTEAGIGGTEAGNCKFEAGKCKFEAGNERIKEYLCKEKWGHDIKQT